MFAVVGNRIMGPWTKLCFYQPAADDEGHGGGVWFQFRIVSPAGESFSCCWEMEL